jgi:hypothetical protein
MRDGQACFQVANVVLAAFGEQELTARIHPVHLNGDMSDSRLDNLLPSPRWRRHLSAERSRRDAEWHRADIELVVANISKLEAAGVTDRAINLALNIPGRDAPRQERIQAFEQCFSILFELGTSTADMAETFGLRPVTFSRWKTRLFPRRKQNGGSRKRSALVGKQLDQVIRTVPRGYAPHLRDDLINATLLILLEGRAVAPADAYKIARREHSRLMGTWKENSLNTPVGDGAGATRIDMLTSSSEFINTGQIRSRR